MVMKLTFWIGERLIYQSVTELNGFILQVKKLTALIVKGIQQADISARLP